ncbi:MAG TPA: MerR family transcriptional regulator [Mycobacteriales bacterium]|nr:MerR family transcriptional regulator [Mycobacteriales bacterium]
MAEYRIDDLAREAGTTVRNVRVYQDRGLLPPPRREGRTGVYSEVHLGRLRLIGQLLERGYTFAHIAEFFSGWQSGKNLTEVLGLEEVLTTQWTDEMSDYATAEQLVELFGEEQLSEDNLTRAVEQELVVPDGDRYRVPSPRLLHAGAELVRVGIPLAVVLDLSSSLARDMDASAGRLIGAVLDHVVLKHPALSEGSDEDVAELTELIRHLKPLAQLAVDAHLARAMERRVRDAIQQHVETTGLVAEGPAATG